MRRGVANRVGLAAVGVVVAAAGAYTIARHYGVVVPGDRHGSLYPTGLADWLHDNDWIWLAVAAAAVVIGLFALRWLWWQQHRQSLRLLRPDAAPVGGRTLLEAGALTSAVEDDIADLPGVRRVSASMLGSPDAPRLEITVQVFGDADLPALRDRIMTEAVDPARAALDEVPLPALLSVKVSGRQGGRGHYLT